MQVSETAASLPTPASSVEAASTAGDAESVNQDLVKRGYHPRKLHGRLLYCRTVVLTGTHFDNTVCLTEAQVKAIDLDTQNSKDRMGRQTIMSCPSSGGCN